MKYEEHFHLLPKVQAAPAYDGPVLRVALMGLGGYANRVAEAMKDCKKATLTGIISGTPAKIKDWQQRYGIAENALFTNSTRNEAAYQEFTAIILNYFLWLFLSD